MKLLILIGDGEPGSGGVADHARLLAHQCANSGMQIALFALRDRHVTERTEEGIESNLLTIRVPSRWSERNRVQNLDTFIKQWEPDAINLHWVPHSYNPKGLPVRLPKRLIPALKNKPVHIYFHELWIHSGKGNPKNQCYSWLQKSCLQSLVRLLNVATMSTSNSEWADRLRKCGLHAEILPLFGNFPVHGSPNPDWWKDKHISTCNRYFNVGFFGTLYPDHSPDTVLSYLANAARLENRQLRIFHAGNITVEAIERLDNSINQYDGTLEFFRFGHLSPDEVSNYFSGLDSVITTVSASLLPKSSNAVSVLEHGVPLIVCDPSPIDTMQYPFPAHRNRLIIQIKTPNEDLTLAQISVRRSHPYSLLEGHTKQFLKKLLQTNPAEPEKNT